MIEYKVLTIKEAADLGDHGCLDILDYDPSFAEWNLAIAMFQDDKFVKVLAIDGGEPEDNSFTRDGRWITPALNAAYQAGYDDGVHSI